MTIDDSNIEDFDFEELKRLQIDLTVEDKLLLFAARHHARVSGGYLCSIRTFYDLSSQTSDVFDDHSMKLYSQLDENCNK